MNDPVKITLMCIHGFGSVILALLLPNNYLNEIDFVKKLYDENALWIPASMLILLFTLILSIGITFTLLSEAFGLKKVSDEQDGSKTEYNK
jgi:hypothetical protein